MLMRCRWKEEYATTDYHIDPRLTGAVLQRVAGKDASKQFWKYHNEGILKKYKSQLQVGSLDSKKKADPPAPKPEPKAEKAVPQAESGTVSAVPTASSQQDMEPMDTFGSRMYMHLTLESETDMAQSFPSAIRRGTNHITLHTTTRHMLHYVLKFENG